MSAYEWFESIKSEGSRIERAKQQLALLDARISPHSQGFEAMGRHGGSTDSVMHRAILSSKMGEIRRELAAQERRHEAKIAHAKEVLYGRSGHGGLARATSTDDADMLRYHYLQGEGWASIARRFDADSTNLTVWCKSRAKRACRQIDRIGMDVLADS